MAGLRVAAVPVVAGPQEGIRGAEEAVLAEAEEAVLAAVEPREIGDGIS